MRSVVTVLATLGLCAMLVSTAEAQEQKQRRGKGGQKGGFGGQFGQFGFGQRGMGAMGGMMLLGNPSVQQELKLSEEVVGKIRDEMQKAMETGRDRFAELQNLDQDERRKRMEEWGKEAAERAKKFVEENLSPEQRKRFTQIEIQVAGVNAFTREDVLASVKLTDEQKAQVKIIQEDAQKEIREIRREAFAGGGGGFDPEQMRETQKKVEGINKEAFDKIKALLTEEQKKAWEELTGAPFKLVVGPPRRRDI